MEEPVKTESRRGSHYPWLLFGAVFIVSMVYAAIANIQTYYGDCFFYWQFGDGIFENGLNFLNYPETYKGYFLPFIVSLFKTFLPGFWSWRFLASLSAAICFSFSLPCLFTGKLIRSRRKFIRSLLAYLCFMWFWGDFMQYPLSDFAALFFMVTGSACLIYARNTKKAAAVLLYLVSGACFYASYNTRAVYLYASVFALLIYIYSERKKIIRLLPKFLLVFIGASVIALPQCSINKKYVDRFSPEVYTEAYANYSQNLETLQVYWGLGIPMFAGYFGDSEVYPQGGVFYLDKSGEEITKREGITSENFKLTSLVKLFLKYPLDMTALYIRHLVALMTPSYRQAYITDLHREISFTVVLGIAIWITAGLALAAQIKKHISETGWWAFAVCLPALFQLFGATELRFFLPVYLLCYYYLFAFVDYGEFRAAYRGRWFQVIILSVFLALLWITVFADLLADNREQVFLIGNGTLFDSIRSFPSKIFR